MWFLTALPGVVLAQAVAPDLLRMSGRYTGTLHGHELSVWVSAHPSRHHTAAVWIYVSTRERHVQERVRKLVEDPAQAWAQVCAQSVRHEEYGYLYQSGYHRVWQSGGAMALLRRQENEGTSLPADRAGSDELVPKEYFHINDKEYAVKRTHVDHESGRLARIQLTRTGFIQNPFDNPVIELRFIQGLPEQNLLCRYLNAKDAAAKAFFEDDIGCAPDSWSAYGGTAPAASCAAR